LQATTCLAGLVVALKYVIDLEGTEFSGGQTTGPLLALQFAGAILFAIALIVTFIRPRLAAVSALVASLLCLPIYLHFVAPRLFRWIFPGDYSYPLTSNFRWEGWATTGILTVLVMSYLLKVRMAGTRD